MVLGVKLVTFANTNYPQDHALTASLLILSSYLSYFIIFDVNDLTKTMQIY